MKGNRKEFCKYIKSKRESSKNMGLLLSRVRELQTKNGKGQGTQCHLYLSLQ